MTAAREASVEWVKRSLLEERRETAASAAMRAEGFVAIAEQHAVKIETLINWIYTPAPKKQWSLQEFRRFCEVLSEKRSPPPNAPGLVE